MKYTDPNVVPHVAWCDGHEKKAFTKKNAKKLIRTIRRRGDTGMREYPCGLIFNLWHVGHLPQATLWGFLTVDEVYGDRSDVA